jgi:nucleoside-diphosphate-sugar epimerase
MKLFVLGATGKTGREIVDLALARGHEVTAFVRSPQKLRPVASLAIVRGDPLEREAIAAALPGHDAVLSAIGAPRREALRPNTLLTDCARATVDAMASSGVPRLAIVSAAVLFPGKRLVVRFLSLASQASRARPAGNGGPRTSERPGMDHCAAPSSAAIARGRGPRVAPPVDSAA